MLCEPFPVHLESLEGFSVFLRGNMGGELPATLNQPRVPLERKGNLPLPAHGRANVRLLLELLEVVVSKLGEAMVICVEEGVPADLLYREHVGSAMVGRWLVLNRHLS